MGQNVSGKNILAVLVCIAVVVAWLYHREAGAPGVSACEISRAFRENEMAAIAKYEGERLVLSGIADVTGDSLNGLFLRVECADGSGVVHCFFRRSYAGRLAKVRRGDAVSVAGKCRGTTLGMVVFDGCKVKD